MKKMILAIIAGLALFGCITTEKPMQMQDNIISPPTHTSNLSVDQIRVLSVGNGTYLIEISAAKINGNWHFPLNKYEKEFAALGIYNEYFIMLNSSQLQFLRQNETIWLTPMIKDGEGVLFNAIYSQDLNACENDRAIYILGRYYMPQALANGSRFENDDKWKILTQSAGGCIKRVTIYLDGYIYGLKDNESVGLFGNYGVLTMHFGNLESAPEIVVVKSAPVPPVVPEKANLTLCISNYSGAVYLDDGFNLNSIQYSISSANTANGTYAIGYRIWNGTFGHNFTKMEKIQFVKAQNISFWSGPFSISNGEVLETFERFPGSMGALGYFPKPIYAMQKNYDSRWLHDLDNSSLDNYTAAYLTVDVADTTGDVIASDTIRLIMDIHGRIVFYRVPGCAGVDAEAENIRVATVFKCLSETGYNYSECWK